ncbi:MAG: histidine phosphatase family protein [Treponema sp.]|nr:histidine phosphatase family protein [Treponema sp.]
MKKHILAAALFFAAIALFAETKTIYITRHGQRGDPKYQKKFKFCDEDALMPKGEQQAHLLGKHLASLGFNGTIYVSPYYRTLQTATFAASELPPELPMILEPRAQEIVGRKNSSGKVGRTKKCITKKEIRENFPKVKIPWGTKFPWRLENEKEEQTDQRTESLIEDLVKNTAGDSFIVAHGGLMPSFIREMNRRQADFPRQKTYNCCLYRFVIDSETGNVVEWSDETLKYLPDEMITDNLSYILILPKRD